MSSRAKSAAGNKKQDPNKVLKNYSNTRLHEGLTQAKVYSGRVETHLLTSQFQNHVLNSACRTFVDKEFKKRNARSQSAACLRSNIVSTPMKSGQKTGRPSSSSKKNPEDQMRDKSTDYATVSLANNFTLIRGALNYKAQIVPEYSETLRDLCTTRTSLHEEIKKLKAGINTEKKKKAKISLNCNKLMNENEETHKNFLKKQQENYHLSVQIERTQIECNDLVEKINDLNHNIEIRKGQVRNEKQLRDKVKKYVEKTRMDVMREQKEVARMKQEVTKSYNWMSNSYMKQNQLQQEKASLIVDIDNKYGKYS